MESTSAGELVKVATAGPLLDAIVFDTPSAHKAVVALIDRSRGPVLRTVNVNTLSERTEAGPDDRALLQLIRRTPPPAHLSARGAAGVGRGQDAHSRGASHRPTGK
ncbi:hypothetical protein OM076_04170 [Solirubrobacter ginsenosidimutans]|uniref:Uncharacterized protein n=1 Tax=Solirubrobacter ginsenosidimutans TaxID=490573 RepID=A0A9X3RY96_9ACTN|nr:hypothetical protein [Solirubrobacter ginsenosidimutans]MDA0159450.1 hypothetical protein [Solirubrobacter ginsenosidimutans]